MTTFNGIRDYFKLILKRDNVQLPEGKIVTHPKGWIILRISPSASSPDNAESIYALYRTLDMYLDSIISNQVCYRFNDHDPSLSLPQELCTDAVVRMRHLSNYPNLGFNPKEANQITIGEDIIRRHYQVLLGIRNIDLSREKGDDVASLKSALLFFVVLAEALRFPDLENWLLNLLAKKLEMAIPNDITKLFRIWGKLSQILHKGREKFNVDYISDDELKKKFETYNAVCSQLGIANKINLKKLGKKKKKNKIKF